MLIHCAGAVRVTLRDTSLEVNHGDSVTLRDTSLEVVHGDSVTLRETSLEVIHGDSVTLRDTSLEVNHGDPERHQSGDSVTLRDTSLEVVHGDSVTLRDTSLEVVHGDSVTLRETSLEVVHGDSVTLRETSLEVVHGDSVTLRETSLQVVHGDSVTLRDTSLQVVHGDSVTLPCSFFTMMFDHGQVIENPSLRGRVGTQASPGVLTSSSTTHAYQTLAPIAAAAPDSSPGILRGVLLTLSMVLALLDLLDLLLGLHRSGQERKWREGKEECYNEISFRVDIPTVNVQQVGAAGWSSRLEQQGWAVGVKNKACYAPLPVEALVGQPAALPQAMSQSCPPGPSVPSVQEAAWAGQGRHDHRAAEGQLGAGQVLSQETLDGRGPVEGAADEPGVDVMGADRPPPDGAELGVPPCEGGGEGGHVDGVADGLKLRLTLMTLKLRNLLLSMMILYSSLPSSMTWRRASSEGMLARMALRHTGSPSWLITIFSSLAVMASYRTTGSSYSSGDVK
ncbi:unnamed protein product [Coregonus sp. 'balchen']|nr:unnamed protein product [Coregonus sp. 'balchen']